jgi:CheY-like chemotaxis protein
MGGEIQVQSRLGLGSSFLVSLPLRRAEEHRPAPAGAAAPAASHRLLVVEDNDVGQQIIRHMLSRQPYQVDFAATGQSAIEAARTHRYDLILMDLQVPDMDGFTITDAIRRLEGYADTPVLALTANTADEYRKLCLERGLQAFLAKPIRAAELHAAVSRFLK